MEPKIKPTYMWLAVTDSFWQAASRRTATDDPKWDHDWWQFPYIHLRLDGQLRMADFLTCQFSYNTILEMEFWSQLGCSVACDKGLLLRALQCTDRASCPLANNGQVFRTPHTEWASGEERSDGVLQKLGGTRLGLSLLSTSQSSKKPRKRMWEQRLLPGVCHSQVSNFSEHVRPLSKHAHLIWETGNQNATLAGLVTALQGVFSRKKKCGQKRCCRAAISLLDHARPFQ